MAAAATVAVHHLNGAAVHEGVPPTHEPRGGGARREPVPIDDAEVVLAGRDPRHGRIEELQGRVGPQPLELEPRKEHAAVRPPACRALARLDHPHAARLVVELSQRVPGRVAQGGREHRRQSEARVGVSG